MKRVTAFVLFVFLALALSGPTVAYARTHSAQTTGQTRQQKQAMKTSKKYNKQQRKQAKKQAKAQKKQMQQWNKTHRTTRTVT